MTATIDAAVLPDELGEGPLVGGGVRAAAHLALFLSLSLAAASLVLWAMIQPPWTEDQWFFVVDVADALVYGVVAWVLLTRSRHVVAWIVALTAVGGGLAALGSQWMQYHLAHPGTPELELLSFMQNFGWVPGTLALFTIVPYLVRDEPLSIRSWIGIGAGVASISVFMISRLTHPAPGPDGDPFAPLPIRSDWWASLLDDSFPWQIAVLVVLGLLATADVTRRWSRRPRERRRGLGWLAIGTGILALSFLPLALPVSVSEHIPLALTPVSHLLSQAFFPGAILVVVLGQRLWGIDLAVSRMLVWSLMTAVLTVAYVAVVTVLTTLLPVRDGLLQVVATAFVAAGFQPVKVWVQAKVNRLVHGDAGEPLRVVRRVGRRIGGHRFRRAGRGGEDRIGPFVDRGLLAARKGWGGRRERDGQLRPGEALEGGLLDDLHLLLGQGREERLAAHEHGHVGQVADHAQILRFLVEALAAELRLDLVVHLVG